MKGVLRGLIERIVIFNMSFFQRDHFTMVSCIFQGQVPFAVVGSMEEAKVGNKMVKARQYPWGTVQGIICLLILL